MIIHILKLIRSRMGGSGWILAELLVVFVVIWFMTSYFLMMGKSWYEPVGYDLEGVYHAVLAVRPSNSPSFVTYEEGGDEAARDVERIVERLRGHADVEAVALSVSSLPYTLSWSGSRVTRDSVSVSVRLMTVSPDYFRVFGIRPASGESPERLGEALSGTREGRDRVISAELARRLYGTTDAIGADIYLHGDTLPGHVVAVTGPVRNDEFDRRKQCILFSLLDLRELNDLTQMQITFRLRPSVATAGYADRFLKAMKRQLMVGNFWVSEVRAYPDVRSSYLENSIESNAQRIVSALGLFLLTNVFLAIGADIYLHGDTLPGHVVAVTGPVRNDEFDRRKQCILFSLLDLRELNDLTQMQITFRLRPSVATAGYADRFLKAMKRQLMVGNFWVSEVRAYPDVRSSYLENSIESNAQRIVSALGLFLLTNVFLAVIGTFWFHVSRRRAELGLRMAMGSTRASILGLVMGEGLMLLTIATVPALLICVNLAWIDLMPPGLVESKVGCFLINSLLTWLILALIISLATWYPARKASSLEPADALRYDG